MKNKKNIIFILLLIIIIILLLILKSIVFNGKTLEKREFLLNESMKNDLIWTIHGETKIEEINYIISTITDEESEGIAIFSPRLIGGYNYESSTYVPTGKGVTYNLKIEGEYYYLAWSTNEKFAYAEITYYTKDNKELEKETYNSQGDKPIVIKSKHEDLAALVRLYDKDNNLIN